MNKILKEKIQEAFTSVLPITAIVLIASVVLTPMPTGTILMFLVGAGRTDSRSKIRRQHV